MILFFVRNVTAGLVPVEYFIENNCDDYKLIDGKKYCVKKSTITLNSCGPESDWPCMKDKGCLIIDKFIDESD